MIAVDSNQAAHAVRPVRLNHFTGTVGRKQFDLFQRHSFESKIARSTLSANASLIDLLFVYARTDRPLVSDFLVEPSNVNIASRFSENADVVFVKMRFNPSLAAHHVLIIDSMTTQITVDAEKLALTF